jgi:hypothetical protein
VNTLARVVYAREAFEDGDVGLGYAVLVDLELDLASDAENCSTTVEKFRCDDCGARFTWPGELDHHQQFAHFAEAA